MLAEYGLAPTLRTVLQAWSGAAVRAKHFEAWHDGTKRTDEPGRYSHQQSVRGVKTLAAENASTATIVFCCICIRTLFSNVGGEPKKAGIEPLQIPDLSLIFPARIEKIPCYCA